ncbi:hypothetical protein FACS189449_06490 [Alphaproteobacteria bacterium]|nr:hypothetical protein FACS189449_06490 [Alphaproteobacteria bacterium]
MAKKAYHHVTLYIRSQIEALKSNGFTQQKIAEQLDISQSTVSREIKRNSKGCKYSALEADSASANRRSNAARVPKRLKDNLELNTHSCM